MACEYHPRLVCEIASRDVEIPLKFHFVGPAGRGLGGTKEMPRLYTASEIGTGVDM